MDNQLSYLGVEPPLRFLRFGGFYPLPDETNTLLKKAHKLYRNFICVCIFVFTIQQVVNVIQVRHDTARVIETLLLLLSYSDCVYKQIATRTGHQKLESMIQIMKGPTFNQGVRGHKELLTSTVRKVTLFTRGFVALGLVAALFWILNHVQLYVQGKNVNFTIWLPFDGNVNFNFYMVIMYISIQVFMMTFNNASIDIFISFLLAQIKTQLSILKLDLINIVKKSKEEAKLTSEPWHDVFKRRFRRTMLHYQEIVQFNETFQSVYSGALLYQFLVSGWIMCTTLYNAVNISPGTAEFVSMIVYILCIAAELFLFCYFGNEVFWKIPFISEQRTLGHYLLLFYRIHPNSDAYAPEVNQWKRSTGARADANEKNSDAIIDYAYQMDWVEIPTNFRKELIIFMERIKRPIEPTAGGIIPLSNATFVSIMRSSYSFYLVLAQRATVPIE